MTKALKTKFYKPYFKEILKKSETRAIIESNQFDFYWSSGLKFEDVIRGKIFKWKGKNVLGSILEKIRSDL